MRLIVIHLGCTLACLWTVAGCSQRDTEYYVVDKQRIELVRSPTARAFRLRAGAVPEDVERTVAGIEGVSLQRSGFLESRHGIVLVETAPSDSADALARLNQLITDPAVESEVAVYVSDEVKVLPQRKYVLKFTLEAQTEQMEALILRYESEYGAVFDRLAGFEQFEGMDRRYDITFTDRSDSESLRIINELAFEEIVDFATPSFIRISPETRGPGSPTGATGASTNGAQQGALGAPANAGALMNQAMPPPCVNAPATIPKDEYYCHQWSLQTTEADAAWAVNTGQSADPRAIVALLDDGVDEGHPDLASKIVTPYNALDNTNVLSLYQSDFHGTAVAGIIAARTHVDAIGMAGVSWGAKILPVKIAYVDPPQKEHWNLEDDVLELAFLNALARGADVINCSWGPLSLNHASLDATTGPTALPALDDVIELAVAQDVVVVFSVGNRAEDEVPWPASLAGNLSILAVSATTKADQFHSQSNYGTEVSIAAPGEEIFTTDPHEVTGMPTQGYSDEDYIWGAGFGGTSSAAALVSGAAALLLDEHPTASPAAIKDWLQRGADDLGPPGRDDMFGHGRLNIKGALDKAAEIYISFDVDVPDATSFTRSGQGVVTVTVRQGGMYGPPIADATVEITVGRQQLAAMSTDAEGEVEYSVDLPRSWHGRITIEARSRGARASTTIDVGWGWRLWPWPLWFN